MTTHNFTFKEIFSSAWGLTKKNAWYLLCVLLAGAIIMGAVDHIKVLGAIVGLFLGVAVITVSLIIVEGKTPTFSDLFSSFKSYTIIWKYLLASVLYGIIIFVGLLLLIIPGVYLAVRLQFYKFLIIENENIKVMDSLTQSMNMSRGHFWKLFGFIVTLLVVNTIAAIPFGLGLIVTVPVSVLASTILYKKLLPHAHTHAHVQA
ncbi:MAG: DUF975 family protein [Candidatus Paceibacterota bacterium]